MDSKEIINVFKYFELLQTEILEKIQNHEDCADIKNNKWSRDSENFGNALILEKGAVFDKIALNISHVKGNELRSSASIKNKDLKNNPYKAMGLSLIFHPKNPFVPTVHANLRFFISNYQSKTPVWWFGGGFDLTPCYPFKEDCVHWHQTAKNLCVPFNDNLYEKHKQNCDDYFYLPHRNETRGIGGLFFDDFNHLGFNKSFEYVKAVGKGFQEGYFPIVDKRKNLTFTEKEKDFQLYRRGRYVEFNLLYDRGTRFGLQAKDNTNIENVLASMPPDVSWHYKYEAPRGSREEELIQYLKPRKWV